MRDVVKGAIAKTPHNHEVEGPASPAYYLFGSTIIVVNLEWGTSVCGMSAAVNKRPTHIEKLLWAQGIRSLKVFCFEVRLVLLQLCVRAVFS